VIRLKLGSEATEFTDFVPLAGGYPVLPGTMSLSRSRKTLAESQVQCVALAGLSWAARTV